MDIEALRARADELMAQFERMRSGVDDLQQQLKAVDVTVVSEDGFVTVTVGPSGRVTKVEFDPRIYRRPDSRELSTTVTETIQRATETALAEVEELLQPFVPDGQFQAYLDHDLAGVFGQLDRDISGRGADERSE